MLIIIPPSTTMDMTSAPQTEAMTVPVFEKNATYLAHLFSQYSVAALEHLFKISEPLAEKAYEEYRQFDTATPKPAILAFKGALYKTLEPASFTSDEMAFAQQHVRILSSLYGVLKPLDGIKAYRSTFFLSLNGLPDKDLAHYWHQPITDHLIGDASRKNHEILYLSVLDMLKVVDVAKMSEQNKVVIVKFKDLRDGEWKIIREYEKPAVANLVAWLVKHKIDQLETVKQWSWNGYAFNPDLSDAGNWVFTRNAHE